MPLKLNKLNAPVINLIISAFFLICLVLFKFFIPVTSFAQCQTSNLNQGLISATQGLTGNTLFGNTENVCVTGTADASYREFKVPSYQDIEDQFYTFNRSSAKTSGSVPANLAFVGSSSDDGIYLQTGNLTASTSSGTGAQIIFVRGNLDITGNITYADTDPTSGLVFVVQGNINIYSTVTQVNAILISSGIICTSYITGVGCSDGTAYTQPLVINGSLISLNKAPAGGTAIRFVRNLEVNNQPAEVINKKPKYLYILRNGLFTRDLVITTEDQHYPIVTTSTPALSVNGSCSPTPSSGNLPNPSTTWKFTGSISGSGIYNYSWTGSDGLSQSSTSQTAIKSYALSGTKTASVVITDLGNPSTPASQPVVCSNFTVNDIVVTCSKTNPANPVYTGQAVTWTAVPNPSTPPSGTYTYSWNLADGFTSTSNPATATYTSSGIKTPTVILTNGSYSTAAVSCSPVTIQPISVTCSRTSPADPVYTGQAVTWTAVPNPASPPSGTYTYSWTLGDGFTSTSNPATKTYTLTGNKTATVALTNNGVTVNATCTPNPLAVSSPPLPPKRVFITSDTYRGNLAGLSGADSECQTLANGKSLGGTWKAWLSSTTASPATRFTQSSSGYKKVNAAGTIVANSWADLIDGSLASQINVNESGVTVSPADVWTNTKGDGTLVSTSTNNTCTNWTSSSSSFGSAYGNNNLSGSGQWSNSGGTTFKCNDQLRLYCFEQ